MTSEIRQMTLDHAESIALSALAFLLANPRLLAGLGTATGLDEAAIRRAPGDREILAGILDYLLERETNLIAFCEQEQLDPLSPRKAWTVLTGDYQHYDGMSR